MDDHRIPAVTCWIALEDVDETKGAMKFLKGSHGVGLAPFGPHIPPIIRGGFRALEPYLEPITAMAGEALFFDSYILHGSTANTSAETRLAIRIQFHPANQRHVLRRLSPEDPSLIEVFTISPDDLDSLSPEQFVSADLTTNYLYSYPLRNYKLTPDEFMEAMTEADALRAGVKSLEAFKKGVADKKPSPEMKLKRFKQAIRGSFKRLRRGRTQSDSCDSRS